MHDLSGGEKTKVFLAGINLYNPSIILMDEPTNHLDTKGRALLKEFVYRSNHTMVIVSHDIALLNMLSAIYEMSQSGMQFYPMGYNEYRAMVEAENMALKARLQNRQKELTKAEKSAQKAIERQQKHSSRGEKQSEKKCVARIAMGNLRNKSEVSAGRLKKVHQEKLDIIRQEVRDMQTSLGGHPTMRIAIGNSGLPDNKLLFDVKKCDV